MIVLNVRISNLVSHHAQSFFQIVAESALHPASVVVEKGSISLSFPLSPLSLVNCFDTFIVRLALQPIIHSLPFRQVALP